MPNIAAQQYRKQFRERDANLIAFIDARYDAFYEIAEYAKKAEAIPMRIETPFGDFILQGKL